jgi:hypothetical protein
MHIKKGDDGGFKVAFTQQELNPERFTVTTIETRHRVTLKCLPPRQQALKERRKTYIRNIDEELKVRATESVEPIAGSVSVIHETFMERTVVETNVPPDWIPEPGDGHTIR